MAIYYHGGLATSPPMNKPAALKLDTVSFWINGKPQTSAARHGDVFNPATGHVTKRVPFADAATIDAAVKAATAAPPGGRRTPPLPPPRRMPEIPPLPHRRPKQPAP